MSPRPVSALLGLLCVAVLVGACSSETIEPPATDDAAPPVPSGTTPPAAEGTTPPTPRSTPATAEVLMFTAPRLGGGTIEGADFAGRDVAFWFWAPW
jgi:hypothetical protein